MDASERKEVVLMKRGKRALIITMILFLGASGPAFSQQQEEGYYETVRATVTRWGDTGFFDVYSAYTLLKNKVSIAGFRDNIDRDPFSIDVSNFAGTVAYGATDKLEIFGRIDVQRRIRAENYGEALVAVFPPPFFNDEPRVDKRWSTGFGDVWFGGKYNILSEYDEDAVGLAVRGFVKAPTASKDDGLGTGGVSGGGHVVLSKNLGDMVASSYYAGFRGNATDGDLGYKAGNAFEWGLGINLPREGAIQATAELTGSAYTGADFDQTDPIDILLGLVYQMQNGFFVTAAWRSNVNIQAEGETASGFNVAIGYHPGTRGRYVPPPPPPPPVNHPPTVTVTANPPEVEEGATSTVTADANDPDGDPLTYAWRAPDGRITGSGPRVTWTAPTGVEGSYPVTVTVDDGRGGTASDTTNIRVHRKVVKAIEFEDVHFLFDRYDLTEEARRILDQAAAQLKDNPDLRIEIEGHCCSIGTEEYNLSLGARRADAVKDYLIRAGVPEARLGTISYGESRPAHDNSREVTRRLNRRGHLRVLITQ
jgi:outer membrane protein OmpA-like peptidoglycan-associated protein